MRTSWTANRIRTGLTAFLPENPCVKYILPAFFHRLGRKKLTLAGGGPMPANMGCTLVPIRRPFGRLTAIAYCVRFRVRFRSISAAPESTIHGEISPFGLNRVWYSGREAG